MVFSWIILFAPTMSFSACGPCFEGGFSGSGCGLHGCRRHQSVLDASFVPIGALKSQQVSVTFVVILAFSCFFSLVAEATSPLDALMPAHFSRCSDWMPIGTDWMLVHQLGFGFSFGIA